MRRRRLENQLGFALALCIGFGANGLAAAADAFALCDRPDGFVLPHFERIPIYHQAESGADLLHCYAVGAAEALDYWNLRYGARSPHPSMISPIAAAAYFKFKFGARPGERFYSVRLDPGHEVVLLDQVARTPDLCLATYEAVEGRGGLLSQRTIAILQQKTIDFQKSRISIARIREAYRPRLAALARQGYLSPVDQTQLDAVLTDRTQTFPVVLESLLRAITNAGARSAKCVRVDQSRRRIEVREFDFRRKSPAQAGLARTRASLILEALRNGQPAVAAIDAGLLYPGSHGFHVVPFFGCRVREGRLEFKLRDSYGKRSLEHGSRWVGEAQLDPYVKVISYLRAKPTAK